MPLLSFASPAGRRGGLLVVPSSSRMSFQRTSSPFNTAAGERSDQEPGRFSILVAILMCPAEEETNHRSGLWPFVLSFPNEKFVRLA